MPDNTMGTTGAPAREPFWKKHPVLTAIIGAVAVVGVATLAFVLGGGNSDEAPIRVRNGTIELSLEGTDNSWKCTGNMKKCSQIGSDNKDTNSRPTEDYEVIVTTPSAPCKPSGRKTTLSIYGWLSAGKPAEKVIEVSAKQNKTEA